MEALEIIVIGILALLFIGVVVVWLKRPHAEEEDYPYFLRDDFLSPAEKNFYFLLKSTVSDWAIIFTKVRLGDLFYVRKQDNSSFWKYTNKITSKHVDYLLCDPKTVEPLLGIELDDKSHQRKDRKERDAFADKLFEAGKIPLVRIPVKFTYSTSELNEKLQQCLNSTKDKAPEMETNEINETSPPMCPNCGSEMVIRRAKKGSKKGQQFWGCPNFPQCRSIVKIH